MHEDREPVDGMDLGGAFEEDELLEDEDDGDDEEDDSFA